MARFRKKPVEIEAMRWDGSDDGGDAVFDWVLTFGDDHPTMRYGTSVTPFFTIHTLEGVMQASVGDWVIRGVQGEFYPCKPDIFEQTYEPVEGDK